MFVNFRLGMFGTALPFAYFPSMHNSNKLFSCMRFSSHVLFAADATLAQSRENRMMVVHENRILLGERSRNVDTALGGASASGEAESRRVEGRRRWLDERDVERADRSSRILRYLPRSDI